MYSVSIAAEGDVDALSEINRHWFERYRRGETANGYLYGAAFLRSDWLAMIEKAEIVVARKDERVVGYYLIDSCSHAEQALEYQRVIDELTRAGQLPVRSIARRVQSAIALDHHGKGLTRLMLDLLLDAVSSRYELLFAAVHEGNPKIEAHRAVGWSVVAHRSPYYFVVMNVSRSPTR
jgi:hypothetical protein